MCQRSRDGFNIVRTVNVGVIKSFFFSFFRREEYQSLIFVALMQLPIKIKLLPPAIIKPQKLWSGKQVLRVMIDEKLCSSASLCAKYNVF